MGIAEVIPGVSGGTIAFISGIYERLLNAIKSVDVSFFKLLFSFKLKEAWAKVDGMFLLPLLIGMLGGIVSGVFGVTYLLEQYPEILWSLFFGLILASVPFILRQISAFNAKNIGLFVLAAVFAGWICLLRPSLGSDSLLYIMLAGSIAISALILPGISGSFMLVLFGLYTVVIPALKSVLTDFDIDSLKIVVCFAIGCLLGVILFSRLLSYVYKTYRDETLAVLSGFMLGSVIKIWPWRIPMEILNKDTGQLSKVVVSSIDRSIFSDHNLKIISERLVLPQHYFDQPFLLLCIVAFIIGIVIVYLMSKIK